MKPYRIVLALVLMTGLVFSTAHVWAGSNQPVVVAKPTQAGGKPEKTPGAKATEKAVERATEGKGNGKETKGKKTTYQGMVASVSADSLTVTVNGAPLTFAITAETKFQIPSFGPSATLAELNVGVRVVVQATQAEDGPLTAVSVHVVPGKPEKIHRVGIVTEYTPEVSITIQGKDGGTTTFIVTADTKILPAHAVERLVVGARVTIISPRDVTGGPLTAKGIVVHSTVVAYP